VSYKKPRFSIGVRVVHLFIFLCLLRVVKWRRSQYKNYISLNIFSASFLLDFYSDYSAHKWVCALWILHAIVVKQNNYSQGRFHMITLVLYLGSLRNLTTWLPCGRGRTLLILGLLGQRSRSLIINRIFNFI
jgi:hypothetical protein